MKGFSIKIISSLIVLLTISSSSFAWRYIYEEETEKKPKAAGCAPATSLIFLELNNVRAMIETGGTMWRIRSTGASGYEVPKGTGLTAIYTGSLWMGGKDINNQLKLAALRYKNGDDYWTGPLSSPQNKGNFDPAIPQNAESDIRKDYGEATIDAATCNEYDKFFTMRKQDVITFRAWYNCNEDPDCQTATEFPNYVIPEALETWPAHGDVSKGQDFYLAPFYDNNGDGVYNIGDGDFPWYDLDQEIDCRNDRRITLFGDQTFLVDLQ